jgi:predicted RNA-binding Zn-ribbon protein involved in translation (DUF1610 family)
VAPAPEAAPEVKTCTTCNQPLSFIEQYNAWYCYTCKKYPEEVEAAAPAEAAAPPPAEAAPAAPTPEVKTCTTCNQPLSFIEQYNAWYCYTCKKYPEEVEAAAPAEAVAPPPAEAAPAAPPPEVKTCTTCNQPLSFIEQYNAWYCYTCKKYPEEVEAAAPAEAAAPPPAEAAPAAPPPEVKTCTTCNQPLSFIEQYNAWYCYTCKKYPEEVEAAAPAPAPAAPPGAAKVKTCPSCGQSLSFIEQYNAWYCYNCKDYKSV